jgi:hypothetical protein
MRYGLIRGKAGFFFFGNFAAEVYAAARVLDSMWIYFVSLCMLSCVVESWVLF